MNPYENTYKKEVIVLKSWEEIEDDIKEHQEDYWDKAKFTAVQFSHAATDVLVEGLRDIGIGENDPVKRKATYEGGDDLAYKLGHVIGAVVIFLTPLWGTLVPFVFGGAIIAKKWKERGK